jgi:hypothetical protein
MDYDAVRRVLGAFEAHGVRYVVFGGAALNLLGLARFTEDLDVFVAATEENVEKIKAALRSVFDDPSISEITAADLLGEYPAIQYVPPDGTFHIDILTRLGDAYGFDDIESAPIAFEDLFVPVATPRMLYRMKKDTVRPKDWGDAEALRRRFGLGEKD